MTFILKIQNKIKTELEKYCLTQVLHKTTLLAIPVTFHFLSFFKECKTLKAEVKLVPELFRHKRLTYINNMNSYIL